MVLLLQSKSRFTRITSWLPSPILPGSLCHSCSRFPASQGHPITPSNSLNHRVRKGRDRGAQLMSSLLRRKQKPTTSRPAARPMLREMIPVRLQQSLPPNHQSHLQLNDSGDYKWSRCSGALRRPCFGFQHASNHPCTRFIYVLLLFYG
jgi:hypothetical protein